MSLSAIAQNRTNPYLDPIINEIDDCLDLIQSRIYEIELLLKSKAAENWSITGFYQVGRDLTLS